MTDIRQIDEKLKADAAATVGQIVELACRVNAEKLFASTVLDLIIGPASEFSEATHGTVSVKTELLAFHLFPFFGSSDQEISPSDVEFCKSASDKLLLASTVLLEDDVENHGIATSRVREIEGRARIVRGSAYHEQTTEEIKGIQGKFDSWFEAKVGVSPTRAQEALWLISEHVTRFALSNTEAILAHAQSYVDEWKRIKKVRPDKFTRDDHLFASSFPKRTDAFHFGKVERMNQLGFVLFPILLHTLGFTNTEVDGLRNLIGLTKASRNNIEDPAEVQQRPLYFLTDDRVILVDIANAMDALWDAFEKVARLDQAFYNGRYQTHKGKWLEIRSVDFFSRVFPAASIYRSLSYPDLANGVGATTELDLAIAFGPFLILAEAKAKQFRLEGQLGDVGRLRTDVKANIQDAFQQAKRAADYIDATAKPEFVETTTGRILRIEKSSLERTFLMTISLHQLAGLATTLAVFKDFGLFSNSEYPFAISIADFDFISEFTAHPDIFLHYIEKRLEVQKIDERIIVDELDFLGAYLDTRFSRPYFWEKEDNDFNAIWIGGFSAIFDDLMEFRRGRRRDEPKIALDIPPEISEILRQLRDMTDNHARKISFDLLGLSDNVLSAISQLMRETKTANLNWGRIRRQALLVDDVVVVGTAAIGVSAEELIRRSMQIANVEKYRERAAKVFTLVLNPHNTTAVFDFIDYFEEPWVYSVELERLIAAEPLKVPIPPVKLPGPNELCFCGSGRKFKKCAH